VLRRLESSLFPEIGATPIAELTAPALLAALRKIEHRGAHDLAHRVLQVSGQNARKRRDAARELLGSIPSAIVANLFR
jgi:hypothetical protein